MDPVPFALASVVAGALVAAVLALWRMVVVGNKKCEERNSRIETEIASTKDLLVNRSQADVEKAEARELRASERAVLIATILDDTKEVTRWAVRVLKQYDPESYHAPKQVSTETETLMLKKKGE
jgi:hypothetical protein